jgi:rhodanese-related sulfurtransferase
MNATVSRVAPQAVFEKTIRGERVHLVDVRTPGEFDALHAEGARLVPLERFDAGTLAASLGLNEERLGRTEPLYLLCRSGARASQAAEKLLARGYGNVHVVDGGTARWSESGLPVVRGRGVISLERQVQIAIGALVILKVLFGFAISPMFFVLVALIGVGLVFAGVTQSCALASLLARMPWNQAKSGQLRQPA